MPNKIIHLTQQVSTFPQEGFKVPNGLETHVLFEPERIKKLLTRIPRENIEIRQLQSTASDDNLYVRGERLTEIDPIECFESLEQTQRWMLLHDSWMHDKDYDDLAHDYINEIRNHFDEINPGVSDLGCWMFLSSGNGVVHFHADPDQSFLNQIKGSKTLYLYPGNMLEESIIEELLYTGNQGAVIYHSEYEASCQAISLGPGDTAFIPTYAPHRVINDSNMCIAWNVGFNTRNSLRRKKIHLVNRKLRNLGIRIKPYGTSPIIDLLKNNLYQGLRVERKIRKILKISEK